MQLIPRLTGGRHIGRIILFAIALVTLVACSRETDPDPMPTPQVTSAAGFPTAEAVANPPQSTAISTESPAPTSRPIISTPTESAADTGIVPCGILLPILGENEERPTSALVATDVDLDSAPSAARPALQRILSAPESVGLVAYEIGREGEGIYFNADTPMPLASLTKIVNLVAYAEAVDIGALDPSAWIPISEIERAYLPGSDLGAHRASIAELGEKGLISADEQTIPMEQVPWMMMRHSSNAASDYLQMSIGQEIIENTVQKMDMLSHTAPCPFVGQFLAISNHTRHGNDRQAVEGFIDDPEFYGQEVMRLTESFMNDPEFRRAEGYWRAPVSTQRAFSDNLNPQASARDYARLMSTIIQNDIGSDYVNILVRRAIEWPMIYAANQQLFSTVGYKNGSLPGVLTIAYYGQRLEDGAQVVVVLLFRDLPMQMYRQWRQSLTHDELARWLLADPDAIRTFKAWVENAP
ncbi:MAG: serine hydrolase [Candidatus Promineifilaceae bacterium]